MEENEVIVRVMELASELALIDGKDNGPYSDLGVVMVVALNDEDRRELRTLAKALLLKKKGLRYA